MAKREGIIIHVLNPDAKASELNQLSEVVYKAVKQATGKDLPIVVSSQEWKVLTPKELKNVINIVRVDTKVNNLEIKVSMLWNKIVVMENGLKAIKDGLQSAGLLGKKSDEGKPESKKQT